MANQQVSTEYDICPKSWRLPRGDFTNLNTGYQTTDFYKLFEAYGKNSEPWTPRDENSKIMNHSDQFGGISTQKPPFYLTRAGHIRGNVINYLGFGYRDQRVSSDSRLNSRFDVYSQIVASYPPAGQASQSAVRCLAR